MMDKFRNTLVRIFPLKHLLWRTRSQRNELNFHVTNRWRQSPDFSLQTQTLLTFWGYNPTDFSGEVIVDLGAGSRLRSRFFKEARIAAIEPLAKEFISEISWCDLEDAWKVFALPAETRIQDLQGRCAFIMCINVLDHVFDYRSVVENCVSMLHANGELLLSVDLHENVSFTHPVSLDRERLRRELVGLGLSIRKEWTGLPLEHDHYGEGIAYTVIATKKSLIK